MFLRWNARNLLLLEFASPNIGSGKWVNFGISKSPIIICISDPDWITSPSSAKVINPLSNNLSNNGLRTKPFWGSRRSELLLMLHGFTWLATKRRSSLVPVNGQTAPQEAKSPSRYLPCPTRDKISCLRVVSLRFVSSSISWIWACSINDLSSIVPIEKRIRKTKISKPTSEQYFSIT